MKTWYVLMIGDGSSKQRIEAERYQYDLNTDSYLFYGADSQILAEFPKHNVRSIVPDTKNPNNPNIPIPMEYK